MLRRQPKWKRAGEVLDQHAHKPLHRTKGRAVNHHWTVCLVVRPHILKLKAFRQVIVQLHCAQLPLATDAIANHKVRFRSVERRLALRRLEIQAAFFQHLAQGRFGFLPVLFAADVFVAGWISQ